MCSRDGTVHVVRPTGGDPMQHLLGVRIEDLDRAAARRLRPGAVDVELIAHQAAPATSSSRARREPAWISSTVGTLRVADAFSSVRSAARSAGRDAAQPMPFAM